MTIPSFVKINEVGPRDGLQNETNFVPTATKIDFINKLSNTGIKNIEVTSFVSNKSIPQLNDGETVFKEIDKKNNINYSVLVPNLIGMEKAIAANVKEIAVFTACSNSFTQKNINCSIDESLTRFKDVISLAKSHEIKVKGYISCVMGCPYEGDIPSSKTATLAKKLLDLGADEISLGDTIGVGTANKTQALIANVIEYIPLNKLTMHFHDTYGQAIANIYASLQMGVSSFDSAIAGLGGCPYAKGASGNVATEDVLYLLHGLGIKTDIDLATMIEISDFITQKLQRNNQSKVTLATLKKD